ncbi:CGNR zinc finger domain-containing protein [Streptomyces sp. NPDC055722]
MELHDLVGLGDDPALEILNTTGSPAPGEMFDMLEDGQGYVEWLALAGLLDQRDLTAVRATFDHTELDGVAAAARDLREQMRTVVRAWTTDPVAQIPEEVVDRLNMLLAADHRFVQISARAGGVSISPRRRWSHPAQLLVPPVEAWAQLLADGDSAMVRQCEGCTFWFYDRTKAHRRRWCSMALCGNREKARRHRQSVAAKRSTDRP